MIRTQKISFSIFIWCKLYQQRISPAWKSPDFVVGKWYSRRPINSGKIRGQYARRGRHAQNNNVVTIDRCPRMVMASSTMHQRLLYYFSAGNTTGGSGNRRLDGHRCRNECKRHLYQVRHGNLFPLALHPFQETDIVSPAWSIGIGTRRH